MFEKKLDALKVNILCLWLTQVRMICSGIVIFVNIPMHLNQVGYSIRVRNVIKTFVLIASLELRRQSSQLSNNNPYREEELRTHKEQNHRYRNKRTNL